MKSTRLTVRHIGSATGMALALAANSYTFAGIPQNLAAGSGPYQFNFQMVRKNTTAGLFAVQVRVADKAFKGDKQFVPVDTVKLAFYSPSSGLFVSTQIVALEEGDSIFNFKHESDGIVPRRYSPKTKMLNSTGKDTSMAVCQGEPPTAETCFPLMSMVAGRYPFNINSARYMNSPRELIEYLNGNEVVYKSNVGPSNNSILIPEAVAADFEEKLAARQEEKRAEEEKTRQANQVIIDAQKAERAKQAAIEAANLDASMAKIPKGTAMFCESADLLSSGQMISSLSYRCDLTGNKSWHIRDLTAKGWDVANEQRTLTEAVGGGKAYGVSLTLKKM